MNKDGTPKGGTVMVTRLSIMMFLQFFAWGSWFATMGAAFSMAGEGVSSVTGFAYETAPIAAIFAPLFLGLIADRLFSSQIVMGFISVLGGAILFAVPYLTNNPTIMVYAILAHMLCYMPTLGLGNTIAFSHIPTQNDFPKIRVWGTIGWIVAGLLVGFLGWSNKFEIFTLGAIATVALGLYCFTLPNTPPPLKGKPWDFRSLLMLDAFKLMLSPAFFVFAICSMLICIPLAYYYGSGSTFLNHTGFEQSAATLTIGQMSEIFFMLLIPFFFRKLGVKMMILVGMLAWVIRYVLFAMGAPNQVTWMLIAGIVLHGICYDFFFVTGFMYTDNKAPKEIRGQAQSLLVFLTQGIGMFFGYRIMAGGNLKIPFTTKEIRLDWTGGKIAEFFGYELPEKVAGVSGEKISKLGDQVTSGADYIAALGEARGEQETVSFGETFTKMFSQNLPESLDQDLLGKTMDQWQNFWYFPAAFAALVMIVFAICFWDRMKEEDELAEK